MNCCKIFRNICNWSGVDLWNELLIIWNRKNLAHVQLGLIFSWEASLRSDQLKLALWRGWLVISVLHNIKTQLLIKIILNTFKNSYGYSKFFKKKFCATLTWEMFYQKKKKRNEQFSKQNCIDIATLLIWHVASSLLNPNHPCLMWNTLRPLGHGSSPMSNPYGCRSYYWVYCLYFFLYLFKVGCHMLF